jgi:hypothetical protein
LTMGPIEAAVRKEVPEGSALAEIAYKLALTLDAGDGSTAMARELRAILAELRQRPRATRMKLVDDHDDEDNHEEDTWPPEGGLWVNGKKVE